MVQQSNSSQYIFFDPGLPWILIEDPIWHIMLVLTISIIIRGPWLPPPLSAGEHWLVLTRDLGCHHPSVQRCTFDHLYIRDLGCHTTPQCRGEHWLVLAVYILGILAPQCRGTNVDCLYIREGPWLPPPLSAGGNIGLC